DRGAAGAARGVRGGDRGLGHYGNISRRRSTLDTRRTGRFSAKGIGESGRTYVQRGYLTAPDAQSWEAARPNAGVGRAPRGENFRHGKSGIPMSESSEHAT